MQTALIEPPKIKEKISKIDRFLDWFVCDSPMSEIEKKIWTGAAVAATAAGSTALAVGVDYWVSKIDFNQLYSTLCKTIYYF
jgi:hypothetical protein